MSNLTLDGSTSFIGTEFIKLLATGSSNLATEEYVDDAIAQGGVGNGNGNVDLSNYYTQTETDNLLNNKLNVNNPQDITGNLRLDPTNGLSKIILNAVSPPNANDDFYCNGSGQFNGTLRVSVLTSDGDINADGCNADTFNSHITTNDIIYKHSDVEYMRYSQSDTSLNLSKDLDMKTSTLKTNTISTNGLNDMVFNVDTLGEFLRFQVSDSTLRVPNTRSFLSQNIFTDIIKPLAISNDVSFQGQNTTDDGYEEYFKINSTTKTVDFSKGISSIKCNDFNSDDNNDVILKQNNIEFIRLKTNGNMEIKRLCSFISTLALDASGALSIFRNPAGGIERIDIKNNFGTGRHRFIIANNTILEMTTSLIQATRILQCDAGVKTNTINSNGDVNLLLQRNGSTYINFNTDKVEISQPLHLANEFVLDTFDLLKMRSSLENGVYIYDIRNDQALNSMIRFRIGTGGSSTIIMQITGTKVSVSQDLVMGATKSVKTDIIDTPTDTDLIFKRNTSEVLRVRASDNLILTSDTSDFSSPKVYSNEYLNRTSSYDTVFYGANSTSDGRVEYMRWNRSAQQLDFNAPIDNTGIAITGNIIDTTVSDERLKTNVQDIESNFTDCVKNVKLKTFKYKDEKYKKNDKFGFIAQQLQEHLPKECNEIVKENKTKDSDDKYLSINYMKLSVVLWGALQETLNKVEHLEASMYEIINEIKELKGKKTTKPKAKAKSKAKVEK